MKLLAIQIRSCKQCYENNGIYRPCTFHHVNLDDTWIDPDCPLPEWSDNNTKEPAQQHLTKQGSEPSEISLLIDRYENMSPNGFYAYVTSRLPKWRKLLPC